MPETVKSMSLVNCKIGFRYVVVLLCFLLKLQLIFTQTFVEQTDILLPSLTYSSIAWGDYDNNGTLDILLTGITEAGAISKIYKNNGDNTFTEITASLTGVANGSVAWGDYDNDGYLDILLAGSKSSIENTTKLYRNNGDETFSEQTGVALPPVTSSSLAWGDYDNDGYLDILLTGYTLTSTTSISRIYHNNGDNTFTESGISLTGVANGNAVWGDYDNDGYLDIVLTGSGSTKIYRNNGDGTFTVQSIALLGLTDGMVAWGDYNSDGYLDILLHGKENEYSVVYRNNGDNTFTALANVSTKKNQNGSVAWGDYDNDGYLDILVTGKESGKGSKVFRNNHDDTFTELTGDTLAEVEYGSGIWGDYNNDGKLDVLLTGSGATKLYMNNISVHNTRASAPANLNATVNGTSVVFTWDKTTDAETSQNGLSYNLYIYEDGQTNYKRTPNAITQNNLHNGCRLIAQIGNIQYSHAGYTLKNLPFGSYKWSVQAVDAGLQGGYFAAEAFFSISILSNVGVDVANGQITNTTTAMSYSLNSTNGIDGIWTACITSNTNVNFGAGGFDVWVHANGLVILDKRKVATIAPQAASPDYSIDYINEVTNQVVSSTDEYSASPDKYGFTSGSGAKIAVNPGQNLYFRIKATTSSVASAIQTLTVANRPATPVYSIDMVNETTREDIPSTYEYSVNPDMTGAITGSGIKIPVDPGQDLYFRVKATLFSFKSFIQTIIIPHIFSEQTGIPITGVAISSAAWGDYDNDGYLDIVITGLTTAGSAISRIYKNNGDNTFTEQTGITLVGVSDGSVAWGDYDNNGYLDILLTGWTGTADITKIYRNNGDGTFTEQTGIILPGVSMSSVAWGDCDNDGFLDILLTGSSSKYISKIFHNNGDNTFTESAGVALTGVYNSSVAWGDYNNDGNLDILLTGDTGSARVSKIYRNNGNNTFTEQTSINLTGVSDGSVAWGDYDNDGYLDIILTGAAGTYPTYNLISKVYHNETGLSFTELPGVTITGVYNGSVAWGDYNNDGYSDILLTGRTGSVGISKIYVNSGSSTFTEQTRIVLPGLYYGCALWGDYDNDDNLDILLTGNSSLSRISKIYHNNREATNNAASAPSGLRTTSQNGSEVTFKWNKSVDNETPQNGLTYNLYVYEDVTKAFKRTPGAFLQAQSNNGHRLIAQSVNIQYSENGYTMRNLPSAYYRWSVQAVDGGLRGGSFAVEDSFQFVNLNKVKVEVTNNQIISTSGAMEYSIDSKDGSDGIWLQCTDSNTVFNFNKGGFDIWMRQANYSQNNRKIAIVPLQSVAPSYTIDYFHETTSENFLSADEYSLDPDMIGSISGNGKKLALVPGRNLYFRVKATDSTVSSGIQLLTVPNRPPVPAYTINYADETTTGPVAASDEYSMQSNMGSPEIGKGTKIQIIPGQDVYFRTKSTNASFSSGIQELLVKDRPAVPTNPSVNDASNTFDWSNNSLFGGISDYEFTVDSGKSWTTCFEKPITIGNKDLNFGMLQVRIKASAGNFCSGIVYSNDVFTKNYTGINDFTNQDITLFPNPANDLIIIDKLIESAEVTVYSLDGLLVKSVYLNKSDKISVNELPKGMYVLKIQGNKIKGETKFIKQ